VKALPGIANQSSQAGFDIEMDILEVNRPIEQSVGDLFADHCHSTLNIGQITAGQNPASMKHAGMRE
jgi:hypothetical protein